MGTPRAATLSNSSVSFSIETSLLLSNSALTVLKRLSAPTLDKDFERAERRGRRTEGAEEEEEEEESLEEDLAAIVTIFNRKKAKKGGELQ